MQVLHSDIQAFQIVTCSGHLDNAINSLWIRWAALNEYANLPLLPLT